MSALLDSMAQAFCGSDARREVARKLAKSEENVLRQVGEGRG